jgi:hypothetical protein
MMAGLRTLLWLFQITACGSPAAKIGPLIFQQYVQRLAIACFEES